MPYAVEQMQAHSAVAEFRLGTMSADAETIAKALSAHRSLKSQLSRRERPYAWAHWHQTLGIMHRALAGYGQRSRHLLEARAAFESALEEYRREVYPQQWAETTAFLCRTLSAIASSAPDWRHVSGIADDLIEGVHTLARAGLSRTQQRSLLRTLQGIGDISAFAHVRLGEPDRAFESLALARAVGSDLAFRLASGSRDDGARQTLESFRRWQSLQIAVERQLRESLDQAGKAQPVSAERLEDLRAAYQELMASLKASGALERGRIHLAAFAEGLNAASVAAIIFASEHGGGILIVTPGTRSIAPSAVIELPQLTSSRLEALLHGEGTAEGGWLAAYERYRKQSSSWEESEVERAVFVWNSEIEAVLPQLWDLVIGPLADWLGREAPNAQDVHLMVPGLMSMLPLHAARAAHEHAPYFAERWAVAYLPSPRALMPRPSARESAEPALLAITDPAGDIGAGVNPAWSFFSDSRRRKMRGDARTVAAALEAASDISHVSFFCHGIWEGSDPDLSHLVMADGSQLSAQELAAIDLRGVDLALLGACETALIGMRHTPDEFTGLPVALLQAGVRSVAASQWLVDAASTYALMHRMMEEHRAGLSPARALQAAQRAFLAGEMDTDHDLPNGAAMLSRLRTLRPLTGTAPDAQGQTGPPADQVLPRRSAPFFWAAFAVIGQG
jgi:CHAT domain-containing protein